MQNRSVNAAPWSQSAKKENGENGNNESVFQGKKISPHFRALVRAGLQRDFDRIFDDGAINEIDPAVNERDPAAGVPA
ncbi:MAG: hypothetical protein Q8O19_01985 [Rectinemataceae bacterium]|nr:hypothetical protein [Rectinemataceae bacterium]